MSLFGLGYATVQNAVAITFQYGYPMANLWLSYGYEKQENTRVV